MGSMASINIGNYDFISYKNTFGDLLTIYSPEDLKVSEKTEDGETYTQYAYITTVERAKKCLDCLGYTSLMAKKSFENSKQKDIEFLDEFYEKGYCDYDSKTLKRHFSFEKWCQAAQKYALLLSQDCFTSKCEYENLEKQRQRKDLTVTEKIVLDSLPFDHSIHFFGIHSESTWEVFRVLLDSFQPNQEIALDYSNLYYGGWCYDYPEDSDFCDSKTIILTEGSYDAEVISKSMRLLYPFMSKFYSFIDFSVANVQGSANFLTHYVKAFIGAGIQNRVIALYDNDAAGHNEMDSLKNIVLPDNFRIMTLPDIALAENYPTIGPTKDESLNINGKACSIELYLGGDVLADQNRLSSIMWKGYIDKIGIYQGEIINKSNIQKRFEQKLKEAEKNGVKDFENWRELDLLLNTLFNAFI